MADIQQRLSAAQDRLTNRDRQIGAWLEGGFEQIAFLTIHEASKRIGVSEASIVRFAQKLGFGSYSAMQQEAQELVKNSSLSAKMNDLGAEDITEPYGKNYRSDLENLHRTYGALEPDTFAAATEQMAQARNVYVIGLRASYGLASYITFALNMARPNVHMLELTRDNIFEQLYGCGEEDLLIAVSMMKPARITVEIAREAKTKFGVQLLAITNSKLSAISACADHIVTFRARGSFSSYTAGFSVAGALVDGATRIIGKDAQRRTAELDALNAGRIHLPN